MLNISLLGQTVNEQIKNYIKQSEAYSKDSQKIDSALFYAVQADLLFKESEIEDYDVQRTIELKYFEVFRLLDQEEEKRERIRNLLQLASKYEGISSRFFYYNAGRLASHYLQTEELDSAGKYYRLAYNGTIEHGEKLFRASALNNLGIYCLKKEEWDSSMFYFNKAMIVLEPGNELDSMLFVSIKDNIVDYKLWNKDTLAAIALLNENLDYLRQKELHESSRYLNYSFHLFQLYYSRKNYQLATQLLNRIEPSVNDQSNEIDFKDRIKFYKNKLALLEKNDGSKEDRILAFQQINALQLKLNEKIKEKQTNKEKVSKEYRRLLIERTINSAEEKIEAAKTNSQHKTILILLISIVFAVIGILIRLNYKRELKLSESEKQLKEKELQLTELENEKLLNDLHHKSNDFSDLVMQVSLKEDWNQDIIEKLEELRKKGEDLNANSINTLIRELKQKSQAYDRVNLQQKGIKEVNSAFFSRLDERFPKLTKSERELCGLIRLRLDGKEIAVIRNIHPSSVRKLRHRLRKKLEMESDKDIYDFIAKI